jgi:ribosomal protein S4
MSDLPTARQLIDHLEARVSDKKVDDDVLRVAVADLINVANLLELEVKRLNQRLDQVERRS